MGNKQFILMVVDYFTKKIETKTLVDIPAKKVISFLWKNIICRFGIPKVLITNNETQFNNYKIKEQCHRLHINHQFSLVSHPRQIARLNLSIKFCSMGSKRR